MIDLSKLKHGDFIYAINAGIKPNIYKMIIDDITCDEYVFSKTYNIKVLLPNGLYKFIEFFLPSKNNSQIENKAYIKSLNDSIISEYKNENSFIIGFDKDILISSYINDIERHIELIEETINRGKLNLIELNEKLNHIKKQIFEENKE